MNTYRYPVANTVTKSDDDLLPKTTVVSYEVQKPRRRSCWRWCIPVTICCVLVIALLLAGIGIAVYFLYPRVPTITANVSSLQMQSINVAALTLNVLITLQIGVDNQNYLDLQADSLKANVFYTGKQIGIVTYNQTLTFPKKTDSKQNVPLIFTTTTTDTSLLYNFATTCSASGSRSVDLSIDGSYNAFVRGISLSFPGTFTKDVTSPCCFGSGC
jgi:hypothetical protein